MAELIDSPKLKVKLAARNTKSIMIQVEGDTRYHLAAQFNTDRVYRGLNSGYWQPIISLTEAHECQLAVNKD